MCLPVAKYVFKVEREWEHAGLKCAVVQAREGGHRCGYVRVPKTHAAYGRPLDGYRRSDEALTDLISVHGGITFSEIEPCAHEDGRGYWFGFDCAHAGDRHYEPGKEPEYEKKFQARWAKEHPEYTHLHDNDHWWTLEDVVVETERFADQLAALATITEPRSVRFAKRLKVEKKLRVRRREFRKLKTNLDSLTKAIEAKKGS